MEASITVKVLFFSVFLVVLVSMFVLVYYIGKLPERKDWNDLIEQGKIPKPRGKKK